MVRYIVFLVFSFCLTLNAQIHKGVQSFTWQTGNATQPFVFAESDGVDNETSLPMKELLVPIAGGIEADSIDLTVSFTSHPVSDSVQVTFLSALDFAHLSLVQKRVVVIRKKCYLQLSVLPVVHDPLEGAFHRVDELQYSLNIPEQANQKQLKASVEQEHSVLASGKWMKISVSATGVHKIPYATLSSWGFSDPSKVNVFGNGGNLLPRANAAFRHTDLTENAVIHANNAIYFYAQGSVAWSYNQQLGIFEHQLHDYTDVAYYFLSDEQGVGKRVAASQEQGGEHTVETDEFDSFKYHEVENQNLLKSGREWYGERFDPSQSRSFAFTFPHRVKEIPVKLKTHVIGRSSVPSRFITCTEGTIKLDTIQDIVIPKVKYENYVGAFANEGVSVSSFNGLEDRIELQLNYASESSAASGWLNYLCLNAKSRIVIDGQLSFRNMDVTGYGQVTRFNISGVNSNTVLWDVSDHTQPKAITITAAEGENYFTYNTAGLKEFVAFDQTADLPVPRFEETIDNQDLRGMEVPDMLIIVYPPFEQEALRLAQIHKEHSGLDCAVVFPYQIYNEFSSGSPDISAIRDYARHLYNKNKDKFKYMLLFGDGSYDNRTYSDKNTNYILTYQSDNSINIQYSYVSDDYYGCLDESEGANILYDKMDIGIGRFPVGTLEEARVMVDRVDNYLNNSEAGSWKTLLSFVGDDGDNNLHMEQADQLSRQVYNDYPAFDHHKIYFDAYPKLTTSSGDRYPDVNEAIRQILEQGTLIFNYTGHGSERYLAHENVLDKTTIKQLTNYNRLPVFMTATCEFSRYDDYHDISAGEWVVLSPLGGGVALFTTTRIAWSNSNMEINKNFYRYIFKKQEDGIKLRLGEVMQQTKNRMGSTINRLNFTLLGDPALQLVYPDGEVLTSRINGEGNTALRDTLKALTIARIEGKIVDYEAGNSAVTMQVFDKPISVKTLGNKGAVPFEYQVYQNRIYQGEVDAVDSVFNASFVIPKDIRYNVGEGRISYYMNGANGVEAFGADNSVLIGGVSDNPPADTQGPQMNLWLNDSSFVNGGVTGSKPLLIARVNDESGVNISGVGIGHDITLVIDDNRAQPINLNRYYAADKNSYTNGTIVFQLPTLPEGKHKLSLKAWDNLNNSSLAELDFEVRLDGELSLNNTAVYPNPFEQGNTLHIYFEHDAPNSLLDVSYSLYTMSGRLVKHHQQQVPASGNTIAPLEWQPNNLQKGLYILRCEIRSPENQVGKFSEKILVIR
ncbi:MULTISPECIES: type IX secretion system sortase PorU [unclassified Carboxylicivirga]|uniref:type IX secretion system sortase PorU n=1 Tax=Carboxylicivirga TaxID=1628153 RepID=UPI003D337465